MLNAADHLDSDLAVDGLTLLDAAHGRWRWHYPGTPFTGIGGVVLSLPQALAWGVGPETLVSGGLAAWVLLMLAVFLLAWRAAGPAAAAWSVVPLAFASNGAVWLSGRITGGHLLAAVWHAGAFALLASVLIRGGFARAASLGFWCGVGLYLDAMFAVTLAGLVPVAAIVAASRGVSRRGLECVVVAGAAFLAGVVPRPVGVWREPYDAYNEQFQAVRDPAVLASHARLFALECLPRLLAGHRLPDLGTEPAPGSLSGRPAFRGRETFDPVAAAVVGVSVACGLFAAGGLTWCLVRAPGPGRAVAAGLLLSAAATLAGFVLNRNIFNSDNYRYLVGLLVPWSFGFGVAASVLARRGPRGLVAVAGLALLLAAVMSIDLGRWYARFGWVDGARPVRKAVDDPVLSWLDAHPDVTWVTGGYWDVYRLVFLSGGRVRGAPFPVYPNRFPEWQRETGGRGVVIVRPTAKGAFFRDEALRAGGQVVGRGRGFLVLAGAGEPGGAR